MEAGNRLGGKQAPASDLSVSSALGSVGPVFALVSLKKFVAFLLVEGSPRLYVMTHVANCLLSPLAPVTFF